ncbi:WecB/TagA/CpsF family glycosyltransferase [Buttiauxella sp. A111]|uniref:WecB/TagA/CpsF family glycosyltransferase n=1 Tax=Buttiauxella sp. A111 TaxID=2563088 RepID=UPI0010D2AA32|nr:WecB/TagA/CpsF family glycosyltransferase [Buttiauxella sp. A111]GDX07046.1 glycosyltransferase [Buttiauxella sp. A111]
MKNVKMFGLVFKGLHLNDLITLSGGLKFIVTVNAEFIVEAYRDEKFKTIINENISSFDGQVPYILARILKKEKFDKISGSDIIYEVLKDNRLNKKKIFLLGDLPETNKLAVERARTDFGAKCYGYAPEFAPYPFCDEINNNILHELSLVNPEYLFVAFGAKKQEFWIDENKEVLEQLGVKFVIGCGGSISFLANKFNRAPKAIQKLGLESIYRIIQEPKWFRIKRLFKSFKFLLYTFK